MEDYKITDLQERQVQAGAVPNPGMWIRRNVLDPFDLNVADTARRISMDRATLSRVLGGEHAVSRDLAYKLEALTGVEAELIISLQAAHDRAQDREKRTRYAREIERVS